MAISSEARAQLAPSGRLRAGLNTANFLLVLADAPNGAVPLVPLRVGALLASLPLVTAFFVGQSRYRLGLVRSITPAQVTAGNRRPCTALRPSRATSSAIATTG